MKKLFKSEKIEQWLDKHRKTIGVSIILLAALVAVVAVDFTMPPVPSFKEFPSSALTTNKDSLKAKKTVKKDDNLVSDVAVEPEESKQESSEVKPEIKNASSEDNNKKGKASFLLYEGRLKSVVSPEGKNVLILINNPKRILNMNSVAYDTFFLDLSEYEYPNKVFSLLKEQNGSKLRIRGIKYLNNNRDHLLVKQILSGSASEKEK